MPAAFARTPNRQGGPSDGAFGRLKPGVSKDQAKAGMAKIAADLAAEYPETNKDVGLRFQTFVEDDTDGDIRPVFGGMRVATLFVLLIACANVANLLLARATMRTKEAAVRTAIGASRLRVVLPFFSETAILASAGALLGTGLAAVCVTIFDRATQGVGKPYYMLSSWIGPSWPSSSPSPLSPHSWRERLPPSRCSRPTSTARSKTRVAARRACSAGASPRCL